MGLGPAGSAPSQPPHTTTTVARIRPHATGAQHATPLTPGEAVISAVRLRSATFLCGRRFRARDNRNRSSMSDVRWPHMHRAEPVFWTDRTAAYADVRKPENVLLSTSVGQAGRDELAAGMRMVVFSRPA